MRTEIAPELPVMTPDDVKKIEKWFDEAVDGSQKLLAKIHKQDLVAMPEKKEKLKQNTIILGSYKKAGSNLVVVEITKETFWAGGENIGKTYSRLSKMYHVQKVPVMNNDSGTVKSWSLRITGASYSETSYNGHVSTGTSSSSGETLDAKSLAKYKEKGIL